MRAFGSVIEPPPTFPAIRNAEVFIAARYDRSRSGSPQSDWSDIAETRVTSENIERKYSKPFNILKRIQEENATRCSILDSASFNSRLTYSRHSRGATAQETGSRHEIFGETV